MRTLAFYLRTSQALVCVCVCAQAVCRLTIAVVMESAWSVRPWLYPQQDWLCLCIFLILCHQPLLVTYVLTDHFPSPGKTHAFEKPDHSFRACSAVAQITWKMPSSKAIVQGEGLTFWVQGV